MDVLLHDGDSELYYGGFPVISSNFTPYESGPSVLSTPWFEHDPLIFSTPLSEKRPSILATPVTDLPVWREGYSPWTGPMFQCVTPVADNVPNSFILLNTRNEVEKYEVGAYNDLKNRSATKDGLDIHHAVQKHPASQVVPNYNERTAPAMAIPREEHLDIPRVKGIFNGNPRSLLAKDVRDLRKYTDAPPSQIKTLIKENKNAYPGVFEKKSE